MPIVITTVFTDDHTQAVRLLSKARLPDEAKKFIICIRGHERIISPLENTWDNFFLNGSPASDDFMKDREEPKL